MFLSHACLLVLFFSSQKLEKQKGDLPNLNNNNNNNKKLRPKEG